MKNADRADGELEQAGDRWRIRFRRRLAQPPEKVWRALTEPAHLAAWFPERVEGEWKAGAPLEFKSEYGDFAGRVLEVRPLEVLEFEWGTDVLRLELAPDGEGSVLTLTDSIGELGKAARDAAGWHECLDRLAAHLAGREEIKWGERWAQVHPAYIERFGPEAATVGPPDLASG